MAHKGPDMLNPSRHLLQLQTRPAVADMMQSMTSDPGGGTAVPYAILDSVD